MRGRRQTEMKIRTGISPRSDRDTMGIYIFLHSLIHKIYCHQTLGTIEDKVGFTQYHKPSTWGSVYHLYEVTLGLPAFNAPLVSEYRQRCTLVAQQTLVVSARIQRSQPRIAHAARGIRRHPQLRTSPPKLWLQNPIQEHAIHAWRPYFRTQVRLANLYAFFQHQSVWTALVLFHFRF